MDWSDKFTLKQYLLELSQSKKTIRQPDTICFNIGIHKSILLNILSNGVSRGYNITNSSWGENKIVDKAQKYSWLITINPLYQFWDSKAPRSKGKLELTLKHCFKIWFNTLASNISLVSRRINGIKMPTDRHNSYFLGLFAALIIKKFLLCYFQNNLKCYLVIFYLCWLKLSEVFVIKYCNKFR